ncbi:phage major capsid protein [Sandarakinorhabdus sp.]|uniref:phage major capsid protein n=1 Tax=Sandarakinorhabdus sp. TaxID=1916663 RepID=UPI00286E1080|nr:phage major capsid protein [Sandarakinorhabdus sp.]
MKTVAELRAAAKAALAEARAINQAAANENRDLNDTEKASYTAKIAEARGFDDQASRAEELAGLEQRNAGGGAAPLKVAGQEKLGQELGLSLKDVRSYSVVRLMHALANPQDKQAQRAAAFELECSAEARKINGRDGGEIRGETIPAEVLRSNVFGENRSSQIAMAAAGEKRDLTVGTAVDGGNTVQTSVLGMSFIEILRNRMSVLEAGATMLTGLVGAVAIPRQTGAATTFWVAENGAPTESQQAFDQVALTPKTIGSFVDVSRRLLLQSSIDVEAFVRMDIAKQIALGIDLGALNGSGASNQPRGVLQTAGIGSVAIGTNGGPLTWDAVVDLETTVGNANADVPTSAYITNAALRGRMKKTAELGNTTAVPIWRNNEVNGYRAIASNQVPRNLTKGSGTNLSALLFGNFADLLIGMWGGLDILIDPYTGGTAGTLRTIALQDVDVAVRRVASFAACVDAN